jgi:hypothetical protein
MSKMEVYELLTNEILDSVEQVRNLWIVKNKRWHQSELVWYMPGFFIESLAKHYSRSIGIISRLDPPQLMGIEIREGYEPCVVLTLKDPMAFTRPEYTIRGENFVKKKPYEDG